MRHFDAPAHLLRRAAAGLAMSAALAVAGAVPSAAEPPGPPSPPPLVTYRPVIYVVGEGDAKSPWVSIGVARELNKLVAQRVTGEDAPWVVPLPSDSPAQAAALCPTPSDARRADSPNRMVGFIDVALTYTITDRFYILLSHDATHIYPFVEMVACPTHGEYPIDEPMMIAAISQLSTANGTAWVLSQSEVSVPLASYAGVASLLSKKFSTSATNTILAAALSSATNYSIPGFSEGRRLQHATQRLADDLVSEFGTYWCPRIRQPRAATGAALAPTGTAMCDILTPTPAASPTP